MNKIQCPVCKQMLEGEFQMTDKVKCPACETAFVPEIVLKQHKDPIVLNSSDVIGSDENNSSQEPHSKRPKQIGWVIISFMGLCSGRNLILLGLIASGLIMGNRDIVETEIPYLLTACLFSFPFAIFISWKLYCGRVWAKTTFVVVAILSMLSTSFYSFGMKLLSMEPKMHEYRTFLPNWVINTMTLWAVVVLVVFVCALRWINKKEVKEWLMLKRGSAVNNRWWIWMVVFDAASLLLLVILSSNFKTHVVTTVKKSNSSLPLDSFETIVQQTDIKVDEGAEQNTRETSERIAMEEAKRKDQENQKRQDRQNVIQGIISGMIPIPGKTYLMGKTEVTQVQWATIMEKSYKHHPSRFTGEERPVERISWNECHDFLEILNSLSETKSAGLTFRLPTYEEWKYACYAGDSSAYCHLADGTSISYKELGQVAWFNENAGRTQPVGQKEPNAFGLFDMIGNVREWTQTAEKTRDGSAGRILCGGGWKSSDIECQPRNARIGNEESCRCDDLGFRLCASIDEKQYINSSYFVQTATGNSSLNEDSSLSEQEKHLLLIVNHGKAALTAAKNELVFNHFDKAIEKFQEAANYLGSNALKEKIEWTKPMLEEVYQGLAEANYQLATEQYNHSDFNSALSFCREARRYSHPKAQELFQKIQKKEEEEQTKKNEAKQQTVNEAVTHLKNAQNLLSYDLDRALDEYKAAEQLLRDVMREGNQPVLETMRAQMRNGIGEVHYRYAESFFRNQRYNEAIAACRLAKSYNHPKAEELYQRIKKAKEINSK